MPPLSAAVTAAMFPVRFRPAAVLPLLSLVLLAAPPSLVIIPAIGRIALRIGRSPRRIRPSLGPPDDHRAHVQPGPFHQLPPLLDVLLLRRSLLVHGEHGILVPQVEVLVPLALHVVLVVDARRRRRRRGSILLDAEHRFGRLAVIFDAASASGSGTDGSPDRAGLLEGARHGRRHLVEVAGVPRLALGNVLLAEEVGLVLRLLFGRRCALEEIRKCTDAGESVSCGDVLERELQQHVLGLEN